MKFELISAEIRSKTTSDGWKLGNQASISSFDFQPLRQILVQGALARDTQSWCDGGSSHMTGGKECMVRGKRCLWLSRALFNGRGDDKLTSSRIKKSHQRLTLIVKTWHRNQRSWVTCSGMHAHMRSPGTTHCHTHTQNERPEPAHIDPTKPNTVFKRFMEWLFDRLVTGWWLSQLVHRNYSWLVEQKLRFNLSLANDLYLAEFQTKSGRILDLAC